MTDKYDGLTVVFGKDISQEEMEKVQSAILLMRGIVNVTGNVADIGMYIAQTRVSQELADKLWTVLYPSNIS